MGNTRNKRPRRLETPSFDRGFNETQIETSNQGNDTLTDVNSDIQETSGADNLRPHLIEPSRISNEIQAWTENFKEKNHDRITKMREETENKLDAILKEIKSNKSASTVTNRRSEINDTQNMPPSGSKTDRSIGVHASYNENSDAEDEDYPLHAFKMKDLRRPAKPLYRSETILDETIVSEESLRKMIITTCNICKVSIEEDVSFWTLKGPFFGLIFDALPLEIFNYQSV